MRIKELAEIRIPLRKMQTVFDRRNRYITKWLLIGRMYNLIGTPNVFCTFPSHVFFFNLKQNAVISRKNITADMD